MGDEADALWEIYTDVGPDVTCKFCGKGNLLWDQASNGKFFLTDEDGTMHTCLRKRLPKFRPSMIQPPPGQAEHSQETLDILNSPQVSKLLRYKGQAVKLKKIKECKLLAAHRGKVIVTKESEYVTRIGISYNNMQDVIRKRQTGELPATPQPMAWGEWVPGLENYVKRHTKDGVVHLYFRCYTVKGDLKHSKARYYVNGKEVTKEEAQVYCTKFADEFTDNQDCFDIHIKDMVEVNGENIQA